MRKGLSEETAYGPYDVNTHVYLYIITNIYCTTHLCVPDIF